MDHESVTAGLENGGSLQGPGYWKYLGIEVRAYFTGTSLEGKKLNNPDTMSNAYMIIHGIHHQKLMRSPNSSNLSTGREIKD